MNKGLNPLTKQAKNKNGQTNTGLGLKTQPKFVLRKGLKLAQV